MHEVDTAQILSVLRQAQLVWSQNFCETLWPWQNKKPKTAEQMLVFISAELLA